MSIRPALAAAAAISLGACAAERTVEPGPGGPCSSSTSVATPALGAALASSRAPWVSTARESAMLALAPLTGAVVSFPGPRADLEDNAARYLVVPQYATQSSAPAKTTFQLTVGGTTETGSVASAAFGAGTTTPQSAFDARLRELERTLPTWERLPARGELSALSTGGAATAPDSVRTFKVLGNIDGDCVVSTQARLRYEGRHVYLYEDLGVTEKFTETEYAQFGKLFDEVLYPIDTLAFGSPSDVDGNGHIIVLLSQKVNQLTDRKECPTYIAGYFFGYDLTTGPGSNRAEIFYSVAPDPTAQFSCTHTRAQVRASTPPTFIHELQHMISYHQRVLVRNGRSEVTWLNEGLSHIAEEMGSRYYEDKYPAPAGRTNASQLFPDSSQGFITPNFRNAYSYLLDPTSHSVTTFEGLGTLEERGAAWLFLRWLGDQKGNGIYRSLVQTTRSGIDNVANVAGEPFPALFGAFGIATYTDSIDGVARTSVPTRYRFTSRNTRQVFGRLYPTKPNPVAPTILGCNAASQKAMLQGTSAYFLIGESLGCTRTQLDMTTPEKTALPTGLSPQLAIFRLP